MQIGYSDYIPKNTKWFRFDDIEKITTLVKSSKVVISHAGIGSVLLSLKYNKPTIVVPRLKKFKEHTDDHQLEIVKELSEEKSIIPVYDIQDLESAIKLSRKFRPNLKPQQKIILKMIKDYIKSLEK